MEFRQVDLETRLVSFEEARGLQRELHAEVVAGTRPGTVLLVEHASVYTAGRRTRQAERPTDGLRVVDVDRGGKITWHGPGQLVAYPVVPLPAPVDVVAYVRLLEDAVVAVCRDLGLETVRVEGRSGVWCAPTGDLPARKVCAIGVRVARGVTMHGLALNCDADLAPYAAIVPCGITDAGVTTLSLELGRTVTVTEVAPLLEAHLREHLRKHLGAAEA